MPTSLGYDRTRSPPFHTWPWPIVLRPDRLTTHPVLLSLWHSLMIGTDNLHRGSVKSFFQHFSGIKHRERLDRPRHQPSPAGLMAGADTGAIVTVEIFVEENQITPVRIILELCSVAVHRTPAV